MRTRAHKDGNDYIISGAKIWISTAQVADKMLILVRTTPREAVRRSTDGLSLFYTALDRRFVEVRLLARCMQGEAIERLPEAASETVLGVALPVVSLAAQEASAPEKFAPCRLQSLQTELPSLAS